MQREEAIVVCEISHNAVYGFMYFTAILRDKPALKELNENWNDLAPIVYLFDDLNVTRDVQNNISSSIRSFYLDGKDAGNETADGFVNSHTDRYFALGPYEEAQLHSKVAPVYHYLFSFAGDFSFATTELGLNYTGKFSE